MANPIAHFSTNHGDFEAELFADKAPKTVGNFVKLANGGFYAKMTFHRIIDGFMIQGGCPKGTGTGGPGYNIEDEFHTDLRHDGPGVLSMANTGRSDSGGSQFFITVAPTPFLDAFEKGGKRKACGQPGVSCHAVFGKVRTGLDVVQKIGKVRTGPNDKPVQPVTWSVTIKQ